MRKMKRDRIYVVTLVGIIIDFLVKFIVRSNMALLERITIIPKFFSLYYVENSGAAFSMMSGAGYIFIFISIGVLLYIMDYINKNYKSFSLVTSITLGFIMSGVVGNLIDRLLYGKVTDFLAFNLFGFHAPVFNIADMFIVCGVLVFIIDSLFLERSSKHGSRK